MRDVYDVAPDGSARKVAVHSYLEQLGGEHVYEHEDDRIWAEHFAGFDKTVGHAAHPVSDSVSIVFHFYFRRSEIG